MKKITAFLDTSVLLSVFGRMRNGHKQSYIVDTNALKRITFEKCIFESYQAFRGIGGKKPDEGRQDWAKRFLLKEIDPIPLGDAVGKLHGGALMLAHYWVGQSDEAQFSMPETFDKYMERVRKYVRKEDWEIAAADWEKFQAVFINHYRYQLLFAEFQCFLSDYEVSVITYEKLFGIYELLGCLQKTMTGISQRSTIPSEDFEIVVAALLSNAEIFVTTDRRLLTSATSIEANLKTCDFVHLDDVKNYVELLL